eukprot:TRINITY_DN14414_c0_g2_i1.p1 TRINITY_DN14414_c0_g2~~TRINITY_DN14414_c0_g2_i1.p1  ORF type:complete len:374 (+),score=165.97 TRINITY_DN14414_c0_g2_i1:71-1123(+)
MVEEHSYGRLKQLLQQHAEGGVHDGLITSPLSNDSSGALPSMPSDDDERVAVPVLQAQEARGAAGAPAATPPRGGNGQRGGCRKCLELYEVLKEASVEIKRERGHNQQLREEMGIMAGQLAVYQASQGDATADRDLADKLAQENDELRAQLAAAKEKVVELSLTSSFAVEQLAQTRARLAMAQQQWATASHLPPPAPLSPSPHLQAEYADPPAPQPRASPRAGSAGGGKRSASARARPRSTSPGLPQGGGQRSDMMLDRMRRALAPPPKETMGLLVQSMVQELRRVLRARGTELPLERKGDCLYVLGNKRVNLAVANGKLVVKTGGGSVDFLEYLERFMTSSSGRAPARR